MALENELYTTMEQSRSQQQYDSTLPLVHWEELNKECLQVSAQSLGKQPQTVQCTKASKSVELLLLLGLNRAEQNQSRQLPGKEEELRPSLEICNQLHSSLARAELGVSTLTSFSLPPILSSPAKSSTDRRQLPARKQIFDDSYTQE